MDGLDSGYASEPTAPRSSSLPMNSAGRRNLHPRNDQGSADSAREVSCYGPSTTQ